MQVVAYFCGLWFQWQFSFQCLSIVGLSAGLIWCCWGFHWPLLVLPEGAEWDVDSQASGCLSVREECLGSAGTKRLSGLDQLLGIRVLMKRNLQNSIWKKDTKLERSVQKKDAEKCWTQNECLSQHFVALALPTFHHAGGKENKKRLPFFLFAAFASGIDYVT